MISTRVIKPLTLWLVLLVSSTFSISYAAIDCYDCHGTREAKDIRPEDATYRNPSSGGFQGNHRTHLAATAVKNNCAKCHPGSDTYTTSHRDGMLKLASNINSSPHPGKAVYRNSTSPFPQSYNPDYTASTCTNVNCHFENTTPAWGQSPLSSTSDCGVCHGAAPDDGHHPGHQVNSQDKHGDYFGKTTTSCAYCHSDHASPLNFSHATSVGKRQLEVRFTMNGLTKGTYSGYTAGTKSLVAYLQSQNPTRNGTCSDLYCHSDGLDHPGQLKPSWSSTQTTQCDSCHRYKGAGFLNMTSNAHRKLTSTEWIRQYPCTYCHGATVARNVLDPAKPPTDGEIIKSKTVNGGFSSSRHVNGRKDISIDPFWRIQGNRKQYPLPSYNVVSTATLKGRTCDNLYCHSDGTVDPENIRVFPWNWRKDDGSPRNAQCNDCHGHPRGNCNDCHDGKRKVLMDNVSTVLTPQTDWSPADKWKSAMPMFANEGPNKPRSNSHPRHLGTNFSCDECHYRTISAGGNCKSCHNDTDGNMGESSHLERDYHVNKVRDVYFKQGGDYLQDTKTCSKTACHTGGDPQWGASTKSDAVLCKNCHGVTQGGDVDDYGKANGVRALINLTKWAETGHGRKNTPYLSGNPPASFPGNPCWYCHDNKVLHNMSTTNPFRLKMHTQFNNRFDMECVYCHMKADTNEECLICHRSGESLAPQLANISTVRMVTWANRTAMVLRPKHNINDANFLVASKSGTTCLVSGCHSGDAYTHNTGSGSWTQAQKDDVKNQYMMMGVCLQCHDDDTGNRCAGCHGIKGTGTYVKDGYVYTDAKFTNISIPMKYKLGYDPGTGLIKPIKARASSVHFGHKHYEAFKTTGVWKGGKFCWDCHDPHGDSNIYMIHDQVATETDGKFGIPSPGKRKPVVFSQKGSGTDFALSDKNPSTGRVDGICNVCHTNTSHYRNNGGDSHNYTYPCVKCHEHRFTDSHADGNNCNTCHKARPVPRHSAFGQPVDCVKCHDGTVGKRTDILGQFKGQSHHIQGVKVTNKHCYECHWESTPEGLIDPRYHDGYNFKNYSTKKDQKVDLVIYGPGVRPTAYRLFSTASGRATATLFVAKNIGSSDINVERKEAANVTNHCLGCHSDDNLDIKPFKDCKTPRQYAWDSQSIAARYRQTGTTKWSLYSSATVNGKYKVTKALSAHGNASANDGGWNASTGIDSNITNTRAGFPNMSSVRRNVQCFDCHNSHGSKAGGTTSSYVSYSGLKNGANLKEVNSSTGGYSVNYYAKPKNAGTGVVNPYNAGASQCFDCHTNATKGEKDSSNPPWGYNSTFGATAPIMGYKDTIKFGQGTKASTARFTERDSRKTILGGHLQPFTHISSAIADNQKIDGLCTPCHDPHGVSPTLGANQKYAVPLLKGTWVTSPYKEDSPPPTPYGRTARNAQWVGGGDYYNSDPAYVQPRGAAVMSDNSNISWGDGYRHYRHAEVSPVTRHNIDHNTFGGASRISEDDSKYAGLCMRCHTKKALLGNYTGAIGSATGPNKAPWKSVPRIHAANKGWGQNREHSFTCSKCHQPHNSGLPRLMQTNCLDFKHRGNRASGGMPWAADRQKPSNLNSYGPHYTGEEHRGYPLGSLYGLRYTSPEATTACHISRNTTTYDSYKPLGTYPPLTDDANGWPSGNLWNKKTPW